MDEPRDSATFRMAVGGLGLGLVVALAGICMVLAFGSGGEAGHRTLMFSSHGFDSSRKGESKSPGTRRKSTNHVSREIAGPSSGPHVPNALWAIAAGLAGALVGLLIPAPQVAFKRVESGKPTWLRRTNVAILLFAAALALIVLAVLVVAIFGDLGASPELQALAAAAGAGLAGVLVPSPARFDQE